MAVTIQLLQPEVPQVRDETTAAVAPQVEHAAIPRRERLEIRDAKRQPSDRAALDLDVHGRGRNPLQRFVDDDVHDRDDQAIAEVVVAPLRRHRRHVTDHHLLAPLRAAAQRNVRQLRVSHCVRTRNREKSGQDEPAQDGAVEPTHPTVEVKFGAARPAALTGANGLAQRGFTTGEPNARGPEDGRIEINLAEVHAEPRRALNPAASSG